MSGVAAAAAPRSPGTPRDRIRAGSAPGVVRLGAFILLATFAAAAWGGALVDPSGAGRTAAMALFATLLGSVPALAARMRAPVLRHGACALALLAGLAVVLALAGVPGRLLAPTAWGELAAGLGQGIAALPNADVPYRGADEWVRIVLLAAAGALLLGAAASALWPRRAAGPPTAAAVLLGVLYAIPVVERNVARPFLSGALFAVLLAGLLWAERLRRDEAAIAATLGLLALAGGLIAAPRLDGARPLVDYQHLAGGLSGAAPDSFTWTHGYGPLRWPRDGREMLRIKARVPSYWKAVDLVQFDGVRWRESPTVNPRAPDSELALGHPGWMQTLTVVVRHLRSPQFVTAGTARSISDAPRAPVMQAPGTFVTGSRPLGPGDSYRARVYTPHPSQAELRAAGTRYPDFTQDELTMDLPAAVGGPSVRSPFSHRLDRRYADEINFPPFHEQAAALVQEPDGTASRSGSTLLRASRYGRTYALAQRLAARSATPYAFVRRVQRRVQQGATYSESPPPSSLPLDTFLFDRRAGYCQQFSGAMALLLRMGGVPARVASGFAPGSYDSSRREYVVRDLDAHSWVEAYFPGLGWVPFDPTPSIAPPRSQASGGHGPSAAAGDTSDTGGLGDRASDPRAGRAAAGGGGPWWRAPLLIALAGSLLALSLVRVDRRARRQPLSCDPELAELVRALRRSARTPAAGMTLARLEVVLGGSDAAVGYLAAIRVRRFAGDDAAAPTSAQRRALRRELGAGLGALGRLRALWALPPRLLQSSAWQTSTSSSATARASWSRAISTLRRSR